MVLKILITSLLLLSPPLFARQKNNKSMAYKKALSLFKNKRYGRSLNILKNHFEFDSPRTSYRVLKLAGLNYEYLKSYTLAHKIYSFIIWGRYKTIHSEIKASVEENGNADDLPDDIPDKLLEIYYRRIIIWAKYYLSEYEENTKEKLKLLKKQISIYSSILMEVEYKEEKVEKLINKVEVFQKYKEDEAYHSFLTLSSGFVTWKDIVILVSEDGTKVNIKSTTEGINICGGYKLENAHLIWKLDLCYTFAEAAVGNKTTDIVYFQKGVPITMYSLSPGLLWKPYNGDTAIGMEFPLVYRTGDFTSPDNFTLENTALTTYGYLLNLTWFIKPFSVRLHVGKIRSFNSSYWSVNAAYEF